VPDHAAREDRAVGAEQGFGIPHGPEPSPPTESPRGGELNAAVMDAQRVAYLSAVHHEPCELIVCDAYHRILRRELIPGDGDETATGQRTTDGRPNGSGGP
jgi:hypothetical protein